MKKNSIPTYFDKLCSILGFSYLQKQNNKNVYLTGLNLNYGKQCTVRNMVSQKLGMTITIVWPIALTCYTNNSKQKFLMVWFIYIVGNAWYISVINSWFYIEEMLTRCVRERERPQEQGRERKREMTHKKKIKIIPNFINQRNSLLLSQDKSFQIIFCIYVYSIYLLTR